MAAESREQRALRVLSGEDRRAVASLLRRGFAVVEPLYASLMRARNLAYDRGIKRVHRLPRPAISVGNITTGGTGKTPVVRWLAEQFIARGVRPAILLRGYRGGATGGSDEARMLAAALGTAAAVVANADRVAGAAAAMHGEPQPDVFLLDDAFQHRRAGRDFDLVLINALEPFGHGHVIPRGLLREPLDGLRRADAIMITHADQAPAAAGLGDIERALRRYTAAPILLAEHAHAGLRSGDGGQLLPMTELRRRRHFLFCGIGNPRGFRAQLEPYHETFAGWRAFADHHAYAADDLASLEAEAAAARAEVLVTTEKDWVKIERLPRRASLPVLRVELQIQFRDGGGERLLDLVLDRLKLKPAATPARQEGSRAARDEGETAIPPAPPALPS